jgi:hypothetical protein
MSGGFECAVRFWNGLAALPAEHLYKRVALDACRAAFTLNVQNWAWAIFKGIWAMNYDMVIRLLTWSTWMFSVSAICRMENSVLCGKILLTVLGRVPLPRLVCVHIKPGVLDLIHVIENLMSTCHCLLCAFGKCSSVTDPPWQGNPADPNRVCRGYEVVGGGPAPPTHTLWAPV